MTLSPKLLPLSHPVIEENLNCYCHVDLTPLNRTASAAVLADVACVVAAAVVKVIAFVLVVVVTVVTCCCFQICSR